MHVFIVCFCLVQVQECGQTPEEIINAVAPEIGSKGGGSLQGMVGRPDECLQQ